MPNGDIVSGTSDGIVRVFSNTEDRWASGGEIKAYEDQVSSQTLNKCVSHVVLILLMLIVG